MKVILGIGNPGPEYEGTRHNLGFEVVRALAVLLRVEVTQKEHGALVGATSIRGEKVLLVMPQTYVNLSGQTVRSLQRAGLEAGDLLVVVDDLSLPVGQTRVRDRGGDGGHKGLRSVIDVLGSGKFVRLRIGIGSPGAGTEVTDYVLDPFASDEVERVEAAVQDSAQALSVWLRRHDLRRMMNELNRSREEVTEDAPAAAGESETSSSPPGEERPREGRSGNGEF